MKKGLRIQSCQSLGKASLEGNSNLDSLIADAKGMYRYWVNQDLLLTIVDELSIQDAGHLICGLVVLEDKLNWEGGSVGGVICAYRALRAKNPDVDWLDGLTQWIIENTKNAYNPFGTVVKHGAKNFTEFAQRSSTHESRAWKNTLKAEKLRAISLEQKNRYEEFKKNSLKVRQSGERAALSANFDLESKMGIIDALEEVSCEKYTANTFSTKVAISANMSVLSEVSYYTKKDLALRLIGRKRGPWGQFKKRLYRSMSCYGGQSWSRLSENMCIWDIYDFYVDGFTSLEPEEQEDNGGIVDRDQYIASLSALAGDDTKDGVWYRMLPHRPDYMYCDYSLTETHPNWPDLKHILASNCIHDWNDKYFTPVGKVCDGSSWEAVIRFEGILYVMGGHNAEPDGFHAILELIMEKGTKTTKH